MHGRPRGPVKVACPHGGLLVDVFGNHHSKALNDGSHRIDMNGYAWRWFRAGIADYALERSDLDLTNPMR